MTHNILLLSTSAAIVVITVWKNYEGKSLKTYNNIIIAFNDCRLLIY